VENAKGRIRNDLFVAVLSRPSQARNHSVLFVGLGQLTHLFVKVAVVVAGAIYLMGGQWLNTKI
jgi:hypothetical protein